jgi:hypothetical protein
MDLTSHLSSELARLAGFTGPPNQQIDVTDADGLRLRIDFVAIDTLSSAFESLSLHVPKLVGHEVKVLNDWAVALSKRVTYLLEFIGPIEVDPSINEVLIRSTPPDQSSGSTQFYEVLLSAQTDGTFSLRRYRSHTGQPGRDAVEILLTNETLKKLVNDLVDTVPDVA